ncbi:MAG: SCO family protein [Gammaproteobacteria bacterium]|nr:SCO family protein [Gammaproteobacteria bacterium]MDH5345922.1 SCO family protein [Gammaproteobacteria bacterium]
MPLALFTLLFFYLAGANAADAREYDRDDALQLSQAVIGQTVGNHVFTDIDGRPFELASLRGRPLVISMIYTSCAHVCPMITKNLAAEVDIAREALGEDSFSVVTLGFDSAVDTPDRMRLYAAERRINVPGWHFLAGDEASVAALSQDLGFQFFPSPKGFDHLAQTTIIDAAGAVYRQVYGVEFETQAFVEPLKELVFDTPRDAGLIDHWVDSFLLFCTVYDANSGRYRFDYSIAMTIFVGVLCLGAVGTFIIREWRHAR